MTEDEMVGWHHQLNGQGFGWTLGVGDGQGGVACCGSWGHKELDMTERLNRTELIPLDRKEIQSVHPKGDQSWVFIGRTDVEAEASILWPPDADS